MNIFEGYIWGAYKLEVPLLIRNTKEKHYVCTDGLKLKSKLSSLKEMYLIPISNKLPLFCYKEGSLIETVEFDMANVRKDEVMSNENSMLLSRMIGRCDLLHDNIRAAEAFFTGLCSFAEWTEIVKPVDVHRHQAHFALCAIQMDKKILHGKYHQLILSYCDRLLEQFSYEIAANISGNA